MNLASHSGVACFVILISPFVVYLGSEANLNEFQVILRWVTSHKYFFVVVVVVAAAAAAAFVVVAVSCCCCCC